MKAAKRLSRKQKRFRAESKRARRLGLNDSDHKPVQSKERVIHPFAGLNRRPVLSDIEKEAARLVQESGGFSYAD